MSITRLAQAAKNPAKVASTATHTAKVARLLTSTRARAASLATVNASVDAVFAKFGQPNATFTAAQLDTICASLRKARNQINAERIATLSDLHVAVQAGIPNTRIAAQYDDLTGISAKIAALLVTAKASTAADGDPSEHDLTEIDSNGYVVDNDDVAGVDPAGTDGEDPTLARQAAAGEPEANAGADGDDPSLYDAQPQQVTTPEQAVTASAGEPEANGGAEGNDPADYPAQPSEVTTPEQAVTAADEGTDVNGDPVDPDALTVADDVTLPDGADPVTNPDDVTAGDDDATDPTTDDDALDPDSLDVDSFVSELDLPDSGIDQVLADEILDDPSQYLENDGTDGEEPAVSAVASRGGHGARQARLATARRTNPRASDDTVLASLGSDILS